MQKIHILCCVFIEFYFTSTYLIFNTKDTEVTKASFFMSVSMKGNDRSHVQKQLFPRSETTVPTYGNARFYVRKQQFPCAETVVSTYGNWK